MMNECGGLFGSLQALCMEDDMQCMNDQFT